MPFIKDTVRPLLEGAEPEPEEARPSFLREQIPAAFRTENIVGSFLSRAPGTPGVQAVDPSFDPFENIEGYERQARAFAYANTPEEVEAVKANIDRERKDRETLAASGAGGFVAAFAAGVMDPTVFIPVGGQLKRGESILKVSRNAMVAGGVSTAAQEVGLHATQDLRTLEESGFNIAGATVLSGLLGAGFAALPKASQIRLGKAFEKDMTAPGDGLDPADPMRSAPVDSLSAARVTKGTNVEDTLEGNTVFAVGGAAKAFRVADPTLRLMTNPLNGVRTIAQNLAEIPVMLEKNVAKVEKVKLPDGSVEERVVYGQPTAQSVESNILRKTDRLLGETQSGVDDIYVRYVTGKPKALGSRFALGVRAVTNTFPEGKLRPAEFEREVWKALARGDAHEIPEVAAAAAHVRKTLFKPLEDEAVELGLFGVKRVPSEHEGEPDVYVPATPDVSATAPSYRPRLYSIERIRRRRDEFIDRIHKHYIRKRDEAASKAAEIDEQIRSGADLEIDQLREEVKSEIAARRELYREANKALEKAGAAESKTAAVAKEKTTQANAAAKRADELTKVKDLPPDQAAYYRGLAKDLTRGHGSQRPVTLSQVVRKNGGVRLDELKGELDSDIYRNRNIARENGKPLDYVREYLEEEGFLDEGSTVADLLDLLQRDLGGDPVYHPQDYHLVDYDAFIADLRHEIERAGVEHEDIFQLASYMEGEQYAARSASKKGRVREALLRERYAFNRLKGTAEKIDDARYAVHEAEVYARSLREKAPELTERIKEYRKKLRRALKERDSLIRSLRQQGLRAEASNAELLENARRTAQRIESSPAGRLSYDNAEASSGQGKRKNQPGLSGRFKSRRLDIPDSEIEDFLEDDLEMTLRSAARSMIPDIELTRKFGSVHMEPQMKAVADAYEELIAAVDPKAKNAEAERKRLAQERDRAMADILGVRDRLRGTYGLPEDPGALGYRAIQTVKSINHLRLMGGVTLSSFPDVARTMLSNGFGNFAGVALDAFTGNLSRLKLAADEVKLAGPGWEMVNDTRTMALADLFDDYGRHSKAERAINAARSNFGQLSLMAPWNWVNKTVAGITTQNRILRGAGALLDGKISKKDAAFMARLGISEDDAREIGKLFREHGGETRGVAWANTSAWGDRRLADTFHNAMRAEIDRVIVTPGQEKPLVASTPGGSLILQFQSYNFAATQRVTLAMAQGMAMGDASAFMTLATQISLGMVVAKIKMAQAGRGDETLDWTARRWLAEGIDRSGVIGVLTYVNLLSEKATAGKIGLSGLAGKEPLSRYYTRNAIGAFLGPSFGAASDLLSVSSGFFQDGGLKEGDVAALRRLLPYQNLFYLKGLFDRMESLLGGEGASPGE